MDQPATAESSGRYVFSTSWAAPSHSIRVLPKGTGKLSVVASMT